MSKEGLKGAASMGAISPWNTSRSITSQPATRNDDRKDVLKRSQGEDHTISHRHGLNMHRYPKDCPSLGVKWFYAVDSPKWKPGLDKQKSDLKPLSPPKKFVPFTPRDSQAIESAFQELLEADVDHEHVQHSGLATKASRESTKVPVNEDSLFDVDVEQRELGPAYWEGPTYEVRRGSWFFQEGSTVKPCEENLATQLEEGYLKNKPWRYMNNDSSGCTPKADGGEEAPSSTIDANENIGYIAFSSDEGPGPYRLFGAYMNNIVTYQGASTALLMSDDFMSRVSTTVYQKLGGIPGTKLIRGFTEPKKERGSTDKDISETKPMQESPGAPSVQCHKTQMSETNSLQYQAFQSEGAAEAESILERHIPFTVKRPDMMELEEQARKQEQKEMEESRKVDNEDTDREIDHLVLVTHGIGQRLGLRLESVNFIHDVNILRKTLKNVYRGSPDLQALNSDFADKHENCRIQVLPVCWRHLLEFPYQGERRNHGEFDLGDAGNTGYDSYPSLSDITLDNVPAVRNLISDLAMDVLLYQSAYCEDISRIVKQECNRILDLFKKRNPSFKGSVSLCGHSLGSAILFDILCHEQSDSESSEKPPLYQAGQSHEVAHGDYLNFKCEDLFCLGSPIALFQMLKGKTIAGRVTRNHGNLNACDKTIDVKSPTDGFSFHDARSNKKSSDLHGSRASLSSPSCRQLFNIFHPSDPVSYRLEPLISPAMSSLKPQPLPSVKRSLWATPGQSLSMISSRVGQSVGSLWTNFTSGVASSLLNRSLGLTSENAPSEPALDATLQARQGRLSASSTGLSNGTECKHPTLIDSDLETLYDGYRRTGAGYNQNGSHATTEKSSETVGNDHLEEKLMVEDAKVRALNSNGRVDYSVQEGAFDISMIASIASHLSYWSDEDVSHFIMSQMLCRKVRYQDRHF
ncbi:phosphatidic acid-preferring phospholipase A1 [Aspergillus ellipticus CBS 707.79]|uniref:Phosphatidic acid-preferring phospholipase A1 n=1 Tax=Aspergillus ellipticus CBS 707.79 TaxID=1448320 RepID=A0A319EAM2_9EURO|nr:phosphatidic acid-preferring phospholipase A1 [Aspergillus ellipticus CBS 707.79]